MKNSLSRRNKRKGRKEEDKELARRKKMLHMLRIKRDDFATNVPFPALSVGLTFGLGLGLAFILVFSFTKQVRL